MRQYEGSEVSEQIGKNQIKPLQNSPLLELGKIMYILELFFIIILKNTLNEQRS